MNAVLYRLSVIQWRLDSELRRERERRAPDTIRLLRLNALKLAVKQRIQRHLRKRLRAMP